MVGGETLSSGETNVKGNEKIVITIGDVKLKRKGIM